MTNEVTLRFGAAHLAKHLQLANTFYALGNDVETHRLAHGDNRAHE